MWLLDTSYDMCRRLHACWGGCPNRRFAKTPDGDRGLYYLCAGYKKFFRHVSKYLRPIAQLLEHQLPASLIMDAFDGPPVVPLAPR